MKIRPLQGEVLLYMEAPPTVSAGGIALLQEAPEAENPAEAVFGEVRSLGVWPLDGRGRMIPYKVKPGDRVAINSGAGRWLRAPGERLKIVHANRILAIVEKD